MWGWGLLEAVGAVAEGWCGVGGLHPRAALMWEPRAGCREGKEAPSEGDELAP